MASDITLKMEGIEGESLVAGCEGEIDVFSWNWDMNQTGTMHYGTGGTGGRVNVGDIVFTKNLDKASPALIKACCSGKHIGEAVLTLRKAGGDDPVKYLVITLNPVLISSVSCGADRDAPGSLETVSMTFGKFKFEYTPQKEDGTADAGIPFSWNVEAGKEE